MEGLTKSKFTVNTIASLVLMWLSVALLYPAVMGDLLHYRVDYYIQWLGRTLNVKEESRTLYGNEHNSIIGALFQHQAGWAAYMMIFFGIVLPAAKVLTFHVWMVTDDTTAIGRVSEKAVYVLGGASRWVAVDAVVEALFVGMLLKIPSVKAEHRVAFIAFVAYCILSGLAFLLIDPKIKATPRSSAMGRVAKRAPALIMMSAACFFVLLYVGSTGPILRVLIPESVMRQSAMEEIQRAGFKDSQTFEVIKNHLISEIADKIKIDEDVSVTGCIRRLISSNVAYSVWGTLILFTCVLVVPALDVLASTLMAAGKADNATLTSCRNNLKHFAMLDVMCLGLVLSVLASKCEPDIKCALLPNFLYILGAALMWYFHSALCDAAVREPAKGDELARTQEEGLVA
jgi:hypothetical protein